MPNVVPAKHVESKNTEDVVETPYGPSRFCHCALLWIEKVKRITKDLNSNLFFMTLILNKLNYQLVPSGF